MTPYRLALLTVGYSLDVEDGEVYFATDEERRRYLR